MNKSNSMRKYLILLNTCAMLLSNSYAIDCTVKLVEETDDYFIIEATVHHYTVSKDRTELKISELSAINEPGKPQLPAKGILLDIPAYATYTATVLEQESEIVNNVDIAPNPTPVENQKQDDGFQPISYVLSRNNAVCIYYIKKGPYFT
ncbi:hypothetical protein JW960_16345 [candidate division KSB1 bacterium]|nr:hypothetical protein [candidate division KSB1 bacterium]